MGIKVVKTTVSCAIYASVPNCSIEAGLEGTDEKYRKEFAEIKKAYDTLIKSGRKAFKEAVNIENKEYLSQFEKVKVAADIKLIF